jgi:hypothetical protein
MQQPVLLGCIESRHRDSSLLGNNLFDLIGTDSDGRVLVALLVVFVLLTHCLQFFLSVGCFLLCGLETSLRSFVRVTLETLNFNLEVSVLSFTATKSLRFGIIRYSGGSGSLIDEVNS